MPKRLLPIKHFPQEADAGCLAACVQMISTFLETPILQKKLNQLFELTSLGVPLSRLTRLGRYGLRVNIHHFSDLEDLQRSVDNDNPPIIFVRTHQLSYWQEDTQHALLLIGYDDTNLFINDPAFPDAPKQIDVDELMLAWDEFDNTYATITL